MWSSDVLHVYVCIFLGLARVDVALAGECPFGLSPLCTMFLKCIYQHEQLLSSPGKPVQGPNLSRTWTFEAEYPLFALCFHHAWTWEAGPRHAFFLVPAALLKSSAWSCWRNFPVGPLCTSISQAQLDLHSQMLDLQSAPLSRKGLFGYLFCESPPFCDSIKLSQSYPSYRGVYSCHFDTETCASCVI